MSLPRFPPIALMRAVLPSLEAEQRREAGSERRRAEGDQVVVEIAAFKHDDGGANTPQAPCPSALSDCLHRSARNPCSAARD